MYSYQPIEFNGNSLVGGNFTAVWFDPENGPMMTRQFDPIEAEVIGLGDRDVRAQPKGGYWELHCILKTSTQADRDAFLQIFDEEAGQVVLKAQDSTAAPVTWRISCRVAATRRIGRAWGQFIVTLRVADPTWEEDTADSDSQLAMSGNQQLFSLTSQGNRKTRPTFTIEPQVGKDDPFDDQLLSMKGILHPPRSERPASRYPVDVIDNPAHTNKINHQALVIGTDRADVNGALTAAANSIPYDNITNGGPPTKGLAILQQRRAALNGPTTATTTSIVYNGGVDGNPPVSGVIALGSELIRYTGGGGGVTGTLTGCTRGYANTVPASHVDTSSVAVSEQVSYTAGGGGVPGTLTGVVRGVGGTIAQAHSDNTDIYASSVLLNGDDIRVKLNGLLVQRWVGGCFSTADLRVWVTPDLTAYIPKTLYRDINNSTDVIALAEGVADLPERGLLAIYDTVTAKHELIYYGGRFIPFLALTGVVRGLWGTTARAHTVADDHVDGLITPFEVFVGKANSEPPYAPDNQRPAIGLHLSENGTWSWGGYGVRTLDNQSVFYNKSMPQRPASWRPYGSTDVTDKADPLRLEASGDQLQWVDKDKIAGKQLWPSLVQPFPGGVDDFFSDIQKRSDIRLRVIAQDVDGDSVEIVDEQDVQEGAATANVTPDDTLYALGLQGVRAAVTGNDEEDLETELALPFAVYQRVVLWQTTKISAMQLRLRESDPATTMKFKIALFESHGRYPNTANPIVEFDQATGSFSGALNPPINFAFTGSELDDAALETVEFTSSSGIIELPAGVYWLKIETTVASTNNGLVISRGQAKTANNIMYSVILGFNRVKPAWMRVIHEGGGPVSVDSSLLNDSAALEASFDGVKCDFAFPVFVEREDALAIDRYHCTANIVNTANGDEFTLDWWMEVNEQLVIDCEARTVTFIDSNGNSSNALGAITPGRVSDWLRLEAGANNMEYNEAGMINTDLTTSWRGRKV